MKAAPLAWVAARLRGRALGIGAAGSLLLALLCVFVRPVQLSGLRLATQPRIQSHGPWVYGRSDARFTIIEYADLECPYCRAYFPVLKRWIGEHREVNWEWRNLPLAMHDPMASHEAQLAECVGEVDGNGAFWRAVAWIYRNTRSGGAGIAAGARMRGESPAITACLETGRAATVIRVQAAEAAQQHIQGTPTLGILDHRTGRTLEVQGPVSGDALLSAIDWLAAGSHGHRMHSTR